MRISDWSSDVCSSDLVARTDVGDVARALVAALAAPEAFGGKTIELGGPDVLSMRALLQWIAAAIGRDPAFVDQIGRASCRERGCQSGYISVVPVSFKKKTTESQTLL